MKLLIGYVRSRRPLHDLHAEKGFSVRCGRFEVWSRKVDISRHSRVDVGRPLKALRQLLMKVGVAKRIAITIPDRGPGPIVPKYFPKCERIRNKKYSVDPHHRVQLHADQCATGREVPLDEHWDVRF